MLVLGKFLSTLRSFWLLFALVADFELLVDCASSVDKGDAFRLRRRLPCRATGDQDSQNFDELGSYVSLVKVFESFAKNRPFSELVQSLKGFVLPSSNILKTLAVFSSISA